MVKLYVNALQGSSNSKQPGKKENLKLNVIFVISHQLPLFIFRLAVKKILKEGRFTWHHDKVLSIIREALSYSIAITTLDKSADNHLISFV